MPHGGSLEFSAPPYRASATRAQWRHRTPSSRPAAGPPGSHRRAPWSCAPRVPRGGRARCPHRAAAPRCRAYPACPVAVVRDAWPPGHPARTAVTHTHYPGGAIRTSRPTAITPPRRIAHYAPRPRAASPRCRAHPACPVAVRTRVSRGGRARCPHRAAAPRRGARLSIPCPVAVRTPRAPLPCAPFVPPLRAARCLAATARGGSPPLGSA